MVEVEKKHPLSAQARAVLLKDTDGPDDEAALADENEPTGTDPALSRPAGELRKIPGTDVEGDENHAGEDVKDASTVEDVVEDEKHVNIKSPSATGTDTTPVYSVEAPSTSVAIENKKSNAVAP
ncbi:unnamed protein product, partial [Amoebophrya sp. A120]|eukprot:GSA120T00020584001.1